MGRVTVAIAVWPLAVVGRSGDRLDADPIVEKSPRVEREDDGLPTQESRQNPSWVGRWTRFVPPIAWMVAIYIVSDQPSIPSAPDALLDLLVKKSLHAGAYAVLTVLWWRALRQLGQSAAGRTTGASGALPGDASAAPTASGADRTRAKAPQSESRHEIRAVLMAAAIAVVYAALDELHQVRVPMRNGSPVDVVIDAAGALTVIVWIVIRRRPRRDRRVG